MSKKINLLILALLVIVAASIILVNTWFYRTDMRDQLVNTQLPLMSDRILSKLDDKLMETSRGLGLVVRNPVLQNWIKKGEPNGPELEDVYGLLQSLVDTYHTLGANFVSGATGQYTDLLEGKRDYAYHITENDTWFGAFRDSNAEVDMTVYVNDPKWGTKAFINRRVEVDGKFAGLVSVSIDIKDLVDELSSMNIGKEGNTFIADPAGLMRFTANQQMVNKPLSEVASAYADVWANVQGKDSYTFNYVGSNGDLRYAIVRQIPVLGWYLCTEASDDELMQSVRDSITMSVIISVVLAFLGSVLAFFVVRTMVAPLRETASYAEAVSRGDLNRELTVRRKDEIGILAQSLREMVHSLKQKISQAEDEGRKAREQMSLTEAAMQESRQQQEKVELILKNTQAGAEEVDGISQVLGEVSKHLNSEIQSVSAGAETQYTSLQTTNNAVGRMMGMFNEIMQNTSHTAESLNNSRQQAQAGEERVEAVIEAIKKVNANAESMKQAMDALEDQSSSISQVMATISDIADQTNLLALNAAIEAARAGESGRGFAVVADEVRKLAEKTQEATKNVAEAIGNIQKSAKENLDNMDQTFAAVHQATELAEDSGEVLSNIVAMSQENSTQVGAIANAIASLGETSNEITAALEEVNSIAMSTKNDMQETSNIVGNLVEQTNRLGGVIVKLTGQSKLDFEPEAKK